VERYGQRFLDRVYTAAEQAYCLRKRKAAESFAARFAAKEAGAKALGTGISYGVNWLEIEVVREPSGRPTLQFHGRAAEIAARLGVPAPRFPLPTPPTWPWPAWCSKTGAETAELFCYSQGVYPAAHFI
jgi:holo-[acyl-carrier protein] synthase